MKKYNKVVTKQSWDVEHCKGNRVNIIIMAVYRARWGLEQLGGSLHKL